MLSHGGFPIIGVGRTSSDGQFIAAGPGLRRRVASRDWQRKPGRHGRVVLRYRRPSASNPGDYNTDFPTTRWTQLADELDPTFAARATQYDESDTFVAEHYADLKAK